MQIKPIPSIPGAVARADGRIKLPECEAQMPNGGTRVYQTKWTTGAKMKASRTARYEYYGLRYRGRTYKIHRLVCEAFHGPAPPGAEVLHCNEHALDNCPGNLRWGTHKENMNAPRFIAYCEARTGEDSPTVKGLARRTERNPDL